MKAVILAAGKGMRLMPLTENIPKVLVKINGKPFLRYLIDNLKEAGAGEIGLVVHYKKEKVEEYIKAEDIHATIIGQGEARGTGDAVMKAREFVCGEDFIVANGDCLWSARDISKALDSGAANCIFGMEVEHPESFGILKVNERGLLEGIKEKPKEFVGNLANTGLYKLSSEVFNEIEKLGLSERVEYELTDAISVLAERGKVEVLSLDDEWLHLNSLEDIEKLKRVLA